MLTVYLNAFFVFLTIFVSYDGEKKAFVVPKFDLSKDIYNRPPVSHSHSWYLYSHKFAF